MSSFFTGGVLVRVFPCSPSRSFPPSPSSRAHRPTERNLHGTALPPRRLPHPPCRTRAKLRPVGLRLVLGDPRLDPPRPGRPPLPPFDDHLAPRRRRLRLPAQPRPPRVVRVRPRGHRPARELDPGRPRLRVRVGALTWTETELSDALVKARKPASPYVPLGSHAHTEPPSPSSSVTLASPPTHKHSGTSSSSDHGSLPSILSLVPFVPLLAYLITTPATTSSLSSACTYLPPYLRSTVCPVSTSAPVSRSVDLVVSYYDEDLARAETHISFIRGTDFVRRRNNRVVVYNKGMRSEQEIRKGLKLKWADEVVPLPNLGREGATYLTVSTLRLSALARHVLTHGPRALAAHPPALQLDPVGHLARMALDLPSASPARRPARTPANDNPRRHDLLPPAAPRVGLDRQAAARRSERRERVCPLWPAREERVRE